MMFVCPKCRSKVFTPTGVEVDSVECGNCGTRIEASQGTQPGASPSDQDQPGLWERIKKWFSG